MKNDKTNHYCEYCDGYEVIVDTDSEGLELKIEVCPLCLPEYKVT